MFEVPDVDGNPAGEPEPADRFLLGQVLTAELGQGPLHHGSAGLVSRGDQRRKTIEQEVRGARNAGGGSG
jgi:hypothetical protein